MPWIVSFVFDENGKSEINKNIAFNNVQLIEGDSSTITAIG